MKKKVYCGESVQDKCGQQKHPAVETSAAFNFIKGDESEAYSNSPDFVWPPSTSVKKTGRMWNFFSTGCRTVRI